jgi:3-methyladenine DNA glycosylase Tag
MNINSNGNSLLHLAALNYDKEIYDKVLKFYKDNGPELIKLENDQGQTAYDCLPDKVKKADQNARELIQKEEKKLSEDAKIAQVIANLQRAKQEAAAEERFQKFLEQKAQKEATTLPAKDGSQKEATAADVASPTTGPSFSFTKALKAFAVLAKNPDTEMRNHFLKAQGYFDDPSKATSPDRKARAEVYRNLIDSKINPETAKQIIIQAHAFPLQVIKTVLSTFVDDSSTAEVRGIQASYYTDALGTRYGTYELCWHRMASGTLQLYHSLFRETSSKVTKRLAATAKNYENSPPETTTASADSIQTDAKHDEFSLAGTFETTKKDLADGIIEYTFKDSETGIIYTIILRN